MRNLDIFASSTQQPTVCEIPFRPAHYWLVESIGTSCFDLLDDGSYWNRTFTGADALDL
jgi:hypothetical protein